MKAYSINDFVKVKLTQFGLELYQKHCPVRLVLDVEGFAKIQLWELMFIYGKYLYNGAMQLPFENNLIYFEEQE